MSMELCGDCLKLFDSDMAIELPVGLLMPALPEAVNASTIPAHVLFVWRCPTCSLEERVNA